MSSQNIYRSINEKHLPIKKTAQYSNSIIKSLLVAPVYWSSKRRANAPLQLKTAARNEKEIFTSVTNTKKKKLTHNVT